MKAKRHDSEALQRRNMARRSIIKVEKTQSRINSGSNKVSTIGSSKNVALVIFIKRISRIDE